MRCDSLEKSLQARHGGLHAEGHLILRDAGGDFGIIDDVVLQAIERWHGIDDIALPAVASTPGGLVR